MDRDRMLPDDLFDQQEEAATRERKFEEDGDNYDSE